MSRTPDVTIVVPTIGRRHLDVLLRSLAEASGPLPAAILLVDDRVDQTRPLIDTVPERLRGRLTVLSAEGHGPAAARNRGWRAAETEWVAFLDDDVTVTADWLDDLVADLDVADDVMAVQGRITVPRPEGRAPTDWERDVAGLEHARWATADMAYRRIALAASGGFDERFRRAYREDADLGLRVSDRLGRILRGRRRIVHPVQSADPWVSLRRQAGNADDPLMRRIHGPRWRERAGAPAGRRARHMAIVGAAVVAAALLPVGRTRKAGAAAALAWAAGTAEFAAARIRPGPRTAREMATMAATSVAIPFAATWHWTKGWVRARNARPREIDRPWAPAAVLFDRDGTLIVDVPYNDDPERVEPMPGAEAALRRLRRAGLPMAVVSNQSGVARGLLSLSDVDRVGARVEELLGPVGPWLVCPHAPDEGCRCRKPAPGLVEAAAEQLGVAARDCVVIGDIGSDVEAARAAGARSVLVPNGATLPDERARADVVARDLPEAVDIVLRWGAR